MKIDKKALRIIIALCIFFIGYIFNAEEYKMYFHLCAYILAGYDVILKSIKNISKGQIFDENFLMCIATIGALALSDTAEAAAVMLFYQVGELFQEYAVGKSRNSIKELMDICPEYANVERDGNVERVYPEDVEIGEIIVVKPGEKIALDGEVVEGESSVDTKALTGESMPSYKKKGDEVLSGCINLNGLIKVKVKTNFDNSTVSKILELIEDSADEKSVTENFITKFAKVYTPFVVCIAFLLVIIPTLFLKLDFNTWLYRGLLFLVVSCPCALVISIPMGFFSGIGAASSRGILIKGSNYLEMLSKANIFVFDKTGTLTKGEFKVSEIDSKDITKGKLLEIASYIEAFSTHPISLSIVKEFGEEIDVTKVKNFEEISGHGVKGEVFGIEVMAGNERLMEKFNIAFEKKDSTGSVVYIAMNKKYAGCIVVKDEVKSDSLEAISTLKKMGIKTAMLTGDREEVAEEIGGYLDLDEVHSKLLPKDKVDLTKKLMEGHTLCYVGDGINDAPVLKMADVSIAMGGLGSDAAIEASDIVIMTDEPSKVLTGIKISKKTIRIVKENIIFSLGIKAGVLVLGAVGIASMWMAIFADVGVAVIAILNSMRALSVR